MDHLASEYYEISREPNPDNISLVSTFLIRDASACARCVLSETLPFNIGFFFQDSIHKTVFKRCQNKYIPPQRSSTQNKCFVVVTSGFTILGIIYGFWYKNFGPGRDGTL